MYVTDWLFIACPAPMPISIMTSPIITCAPDPFLLTIVSVKADVVVGVLEDDGLNAISYDTHLR